MSQFKGEVGNYSDRTVCTEWGGPMSPGSKNGVSYGSLDYSKSPTNYFEAYIRGMSSQLRAWNMGSFYWVGLKDGDWYSMTTRSGTGSNTVLSVPNQSGLAQLQNAWTGAAPTGTGGAAGGGSGSGGAGTRRRGERRPVGSRRSGRGHDRNRRRRERRHDVRNRRRRGSAGASSGGHGGAVASTGGASGAGQTGGASGGTGGATASTGGSPGSTGGTGGPAPGSGGTSAGGSGTGGTSSPGADSSAGCSCTTAGGGRDQTGGLALLILAAIGAARPRRSRQVRRR